MSFDGCYEMTLIAARRHLQSRRVEYQLRRYGIDYERFVSLRMRL